MFGPSIWFHSSMWLFLCHYPGLFYYCNSILQFEIRNGHTTSNCFIFHNCFSYHGFLSYEVEVHLFDFCEAACWNFDGVALNLELVSGKTTIFTVLILLSYKHWGSSHLLAPLIYFFSVLKFLLYNLLLVWLELSKLFLRALWKVVSLISQYVCHLFKEGHWGPFM